MSFLSSTGCWSSNEVSVTIVEMIDLRLYQNDCRKGGREVKIPIKKAGFELGLIRLSWTKLTTKIGSFKISTCEKFLDRFNLEARHLKASSSRCVCHQGPDVFCNVELS